MTIKGLAKTLLLLWLACAAFVLLTASAVGAIFPGVRADIGGASFWLVYMGIGLALLVAGMNPETKIE